MKQCEIWDIDLNPIQGSEQGGIRPGVIVSGNAMNDHFNLVIVCPITSKIKNYMGDYLLVKNDENGLSTDSEVLVFHVRSIAKSRLKKLRGKITMKQLVSIHL